MKRIYFEVSDFPELSCEIETKYPRKFISEGLRELGYQSAGFDRNADQWYIDEYEFTMLALRWSSRHVE
jgi:hypothetical protein